MGWLFIISHKKGNFIFNINSFKERYSNCNEYISISRIRA